MGNALYMFILPSQRRLSISVKARVYKMRLDALKRKQGRRSGNSSQMETNLFGTRSDAELSESVDDSKATIHRYIALNNLIPELLELVYVGLKNDIIRLGATTG